jgi:hypothetical protein
MKCGAWQLEIHGWSVQVDIGWEGIVQFSTDSKKLMVKLDV